MQSKLLYHTKNKTPSHMLSNKWHISKQHVTIFSTSGKFDWFQILESYTLLLKPPVLMRSWVHNRGLWLPSDCSSGGQPIQWSQVPIPNGCQPVFASYNIKCAFVCEVFVCIKWPNHIWSLCWFGVYKLGYFVRQNYWVVLIPASSQGSIAMLFGHSAVFQAN